MKSPARWDTTKTAKTSTQLMRVLAGLHARGRECLDRGAHGVRAPERRRPEQGPLVHAGPALGEALPDLVGRARQVALTPRLADSLHVRQEIVVAVDRLVGLDRRVECHHGSCGRASLLPV